jgi:hypothetical protein
MVSRQDDDAPFPASGGLANTSAIKPYRSRSSVSVQSLKPRELFNHRQGFPHRFLVHLHDAGAALELEALPAVGWLGAAYIVARIAGRLLGASAGARWRAMRQGMGLWMGVALLPQAGIAVGMALVAAQRFPERADVLLSVILASTVVFEIVGPPMTRLALRRTRESA